MCTVNLGLDVSDLHGLLFSHNIYKTFTFHKVICKTALILIFKCNILTFLVLVDENINEEL